jgi:pimeloyl-ACP methyl ester carboxylesterase
MKKFIQYIGIGILSILVVVVVAVIVLAEKDKKLATLLPIYANKESKFIPVLGMQVHYRIEGLDSDTVPLVLIHGASGTHLSWWQQVAELRYRHSCLIYDLRGYGRSRPTGDYDPGDGHAHVRDIEALIEHVGFGRERVSLMGASLGTAR